MFAFTHIPKTAGTTLNYILQKNFGSSLHAVIQRKGGRYNYKDLKKDKFIYKNAACISGHALKPFINYKEFNNELKWFTFLRDPVERYVSQYIHQQTSQDKKYHMSIEDWAEKFARSNWQVKWIAGEEDLEAAKQIIKEKFIFIGITEKFDKSINMMRNCFDLDMDITYVKSKMIARDNRLKNELLKNRYDELLPFYKKQNNLDIQLYDFVLNNIFHKQKLVKTSLNNTLIKSSELNMLAYKFKRNMIYKPYVKIIK